LQQTAHLQRSYGSWHTFSEYDQKLMTNLGFTTPEIVNAIAAPFAAQSVSSKNVIVSTF
jgi:hypothetical protein